MSSQNTKTISSHQNASSKRPATNSSPTGSSLHSYPLIAFPLYVLNLTLGRKCSNLLPGRFNKLCSTYFGGYYQGLYDGSDDEEFEDRFTHRKAMAHLRRLRGQAFLADRKVGEWSFPCEVVRVSDEAMYLRQWVPEGGEEDYVEPQFKDTEFKIFLEPEVLKFVYVYGSRLRCFGFGLLLG